MNKSNLYQLFGLLAILLVIQSCAPSISLDARWKNPDNQGGLNPSKTLVVVVGENMATRKLAEDAFETALTARGFNAVGAFETLPVGADQLDSIQIRDLLCLDAALHRPDPVAEVQAAGRRVAGEDARAGGGFVRAGIGSVHGAGTVPERSGRAERVPRPGPSLRFRTRRSCRAPAR